MGDERLLLILPEPNERLLLLVSNKGQAQAFRIADYVAFQAFMNGMGDYTSMALSGSFEAVSEELGKLHVAFEVSSNEKLGFLARSFFRFAEDVQRG